MAVMREQVDLLNSLQTMIDSKLSSKIFSKYRIRNLTGLKRILTSIMFFVRKATKTDTNMRHECYPSWKKQILIRPLSTKKTSSQPSQASQKVLNLWKIDKSLSSWQILLSKGGKLLKNMNQIRLQQIWTTKRKWTGPKWERKKWPEKTDFQDEELTDLRHTIRGK